jgi:hypothetical protein
MWSRKKQVRLEFGQLLSAITVAVVRHICPEDGAAKLWISHNI